MPENLPLINVDMSLAVAMSVIGSIQLACRHPRHTGMSRHVAEAFARELQKKVANDYPQYAAVMEMGWNPDFDINPM